MFANFRNTSRITFYLLLEGMYVRFTTGLLTGEMKCFSALEATLSLESNDFRSQMLHKKLPYSSFHASS